MHRRGHAAFLRRTWRSGTGLGDSPLASPFAFLACASRLKRGGDRVTPNEMLAMSYASLIGIAALGRLRGRSQLSLHPLYLIPILWTVFIHPRPRVIVFFTAYLGAMTWALYLRGGWDGPEAGVVVMQASHHYWYGGGGIGAHLRLRDQRSALRDAELEEPATRPDRPVTGLGNGGD